MKYLMNSQERREARYQRRKEKRKKNRGKLIASIGDVEDVFNFRDMFKYGEDCCKGVMWKQSAQTFKRHLFSRTAANRRNAIDGCKPKPLKQFTLNERGKTRHIEAPHINDRQIQKTLTKKVLLPLYSPRMIYDNGASLKGKGLLFSQRQLDKGIRRHIKRYGMSGWVITADFKGFFPNADRQVVKRMHGELTDTKLKNSLDMTADIGSGDIGLPLGVETSQLEMIALPSPLDNFMRCQMRLDTGHYMDDYHILVPPDRDPKEALNVFMDKASELGIIVCPEKTRIFPLGKPFKFCKTKRIFYGDKILKRGCRDSYARARRKIKKFVRTEMPYEDIYASVNSMISYFNTTGNHRTVLRLRRLFYSLFGFSCEDIKNFRRDGNAIHLPQAI